MHIYEYLFTALIIVSILLASSTMMNIASEPLRIVSEREQLKVATQRLLTQILLNPGEPINWGSDVSINEYNLRVFGLAKQSQTTRESYVLDPDKVLRLNSTNPLFISPLRVRNMLNLGKEYGFALEIFPALNVSIAPQGSGKYGISVTSAYGGLPVSNANVTARMYYANDHGATHRTPMKTNVTGYDGKCALNFGETGEMKVLILVIDYYGVRVVKVSRVGGNVVSVHLIGNNLFVGGGYTNASSLAFEIIVAKKAGGYMIENITSSLNLVSEGRYALAYVEPSTVAVLSVVENSHNQYLALALREMSLTYSTISGLSSFPFGFSVEKVVTIGGSAYIVKLYLWRMSW